MTTPCPNDCDHGWLHSAGSVVACPPCRRRDGYPLDAAKPWPRRTQGVAEAIALGHSLAEQAQANAAAARSGRHNRNGNDAA